MRLSETRAVTNNSKIGELIEVEQDIFFKMQPMVSFKDIINKLRNNNQEANDIQVDIDFVDQCFEKGYLVDSSENKFELNGEKASDELTPNVLNNIASKIINLIVIPEEKKS